VEDLRRANRLAGNSIQPGQRLRIPPCDGEAREADAASDIHEVIAPELDASARKERRTVAVAVPLRGQSFGRPQNGYLVSGRQMPRDPAAYHLRRPERAWGADHTVRVIRRAIHQVRKRYPRVHPLAIGDLSARHGGRISMHGSHQSGRDADIGFYFRRPPRGYPRSFAVASAANLDFPATWALISALCRTGEQALGVERIYMTYSTQAMFYRLARRHGVARARLDRWFQYPHGRRANHGIIRHEPGHEEHIHVRFRCAPADAECE
jgi:murein endopeptidase